MIAPFVMNGPVNRRAFETYIERVLVLELRPNHIVIMDNLSNHKGDRTRFLIEKVGAELRLLPPYSLDFNSIENAFSKLKAHLRKAAGRTLETLWNTIGEISKMFPPIECANYFVPAGYNPDR